MIIGLVNSHKMASDEILASAHSPDPEPDDSASTVMEDAPIATDSATKGTSQQSPNKKRPASTSEPNGTTKVTKRRAARACVSRIPISRFPDIVPLTFLRVARLFQKFWFSFLSYHDFHSLCFGYICRNFVLDYRTGNADCNCQC